MTPYKNGFDKSNPYIFKMNILEKIVSTKKSEVEFRKKTVPLKQLMARVENQKMTRNFREAVRRKDSLNIIGEIKKSSPSAGVLREDFNPLEISLIYEEKGIKAISVLTERHYFAGDIVFIPHIKRRVNLPILRKDFIFDEYQIYESRAFEADAVLLIAAILEKSELAKLIKLARELELYSLVEIHQEEEIDKAIEAGADIIGINNRNLKTFETDIRVTMDLRKKIPQDYMIISESGIRSGGEVKMLSELNIDALLVGEALMKSENIREKIDEIKKFC